MEQLLKLQLKRKSNIFKIVIYILLALEMCMLSLQQ